MILVIVYVGAVAVLFLFVVMMLDIDFARAARAAFVRYLPIGALVGLRPARRAGAGVRRLGGGARPWTIVGAAPLPAPPLSATPARSATCSIPAIVFAFQAAGLILLVAMIGAIVLTLRHRAGVRRQSIAEQLARTRARIGRGRQSAGSAQGVADMLTIGLAALPDRRRDPVHARHLRHLPQPQERHHHPDVDRADAACGQHQLRRLLGRSATISSARSSRCSC